VKIPIKLCIPATQIVITLEGKVIVAIINLCSNIDDHNGPLDTFAFTYYSMTKKFWQGKFTIIEETVY